MLHVRPSIEFTTIVITVRLRITLYCNADRKMCDLQKVGEESDEFTEACFALMKR